MLELLPSDLLLYFFGFFSISQVSRLSLVNKKLYTASKNPNLSLWKRLDLFHVRKNLKDDVFDVFFVRSGRVRGCNTLELWNCKLITEKTIFLISMNCHELARISLSKSMLSDESLITMLQSCSALREVEISRCRGISENFLPYLSLLPELEVLYLEGYDFIKDEHVEEIARRCSHLKDLILAPCPLLGDSAVYALTKHLSNMRKLDLRAGRISDQSLLSFFQKHSQNTFSFLSFSACRISSATVETIALHCPDLLIFDVSHVKSIVDDCIQKLANGCRNLEIINLSFCYKLTDSCIVSLSTQCRHLKRLVLNGCVNLTDHSLNSISSSCAFLESFEGSGLQKITNEGVESLITQCKRLRFLKVSQCLKLTDSLIYFLIDSRKGYSLLEHTAPLLLNVSQCTNISAAALKELKNLMDDCKIQLQKNSLINSILIS